MNKWITDFSYKIDGQKVKNYSQNDGQIKFLEKNDLTEVGYYFDFFSTGEKYSFSIWSVRIPKKFII